jgi:hypothetical protein
MIMQISRAAIPLSGNVMVCYDPTDSSVSTLKSIMVYALILIAVFAVPRPPSSAS